MKKLLYFMLLVIVPICFSCSNPDDEQILPPKNDSIPSEIDSSWWHNHVFGDIIYSRTLHMNDSVSVDTLYFVQGYYEMDISYAIIYKRKWERICFADLDKLKDVTFEYDGKVLGYAKFKYYRLNTIEMYNWFKISEIQVDGKPAYEIRSTGTNSDGMLFSLGVKDKIPGGDDDGFTIY